MRDACRCGLGPCSTTTKSAARGTVLPLPGEAWLADGAESSAAGRFAARLGAEQADSENFPMLGWWRGCKD